MQNIVLYKNYAKCPVFNDILGVTPFHVLNNYSKPIQIESGIYTGISYENI